MGEGQAKTGGPVIFHNPPSGTGTHFTGFRSVNRDLPRGAILLARRNFRQYVEITEIKMVIGRVCNQIESQSRSAVAH